MNLAAKSVLACMVASIPTMAATSCEGLASLTFPDATITSAQPVAAGAFTQPGNPGRGRGAANAYKDLPAFCRVPATLKPTSDSDIKVEVWLPTADWNRKYQAVGNGGWAGVISYSELADALRGGYATSSTDTGHVGGSGSFALGHPEKLIDFGWRSEHEMTVKSKSIIQAFYGDCSAPVLLERLLHRRPARPEGSAEISRRLRRHHRRRAGESNRAGTVGGIGRTERSRRLHPARQVSRDPPGRDRGLRRERRRQRRPYRESRPSANSIRR